MHSRIIALLIIFSCSRAYAAPRDDLVCQPERKTCVIDDSSLVIGDAIAIFTSQDELLATGTITSMQGSRRTVTLKKIHGPLDKEAYRYEFVNNDTTKKSRLYRPVLPQAWGAQLGYTMYSGGARISGFEGSGEFIKRRFLQNAEGFGRGSLYRLSGRADNIYADDGKTSGAFSAWALAAAAGLGYSINPRSPIYVRGEGALGFAWVTASVNGDASKASSPDWSVGIQNGASVYARGLVAIVMQNAGNYHFEAGYSPALLGGKLANTLLVGVIVNNP